MGGSCIGLATVLGGVPATGVLGGVPATGVLGFVGLAGPLPLGGLSSEGEMASKSSNVTAPAALARRATPTSPSSAMSASLALNAQVGSICQPPSLLRYLKSSSRQTRARMVLPSA